MSQPASTSSRRPPSPPSAAGRAVRSANVWRQSYNPLRWLTIDRAVALLERERRGDLSEIQWVYECIDQLDPDMVALISLRLSAIERLRPDIAPADPGVRGYDRTLAQEQEAALRETLLVGPLDLAEAVSDLAMATFRGFSAIQILRGADGAPVSLTPLDRWLFARDGYRGPWYWNPSAASVAGRSLPERDRIGGSELPLADFIIREVPFAVDRACLTIGIRTSTCEKDWDAWCEMYGLNQAIVTEPSGAKTEDRPAYDASARAFSDGQGGTLPHGAQVTFPQAARTVAPFRERADYLTRKKVLAGTSGRLTMLAEAGTGNLAGGAHQTTFDALADAEAARICALLNRALTADALGRAFPGRPRLASLSLVRDAAEDRQQAADRIAALAPHFSIDPASASELTGLRLGPQKAASAPGQATDPAAAPAPEGAAQGMSSGAPVAETAMNGAQVAALLEIIAKVRSDEIPRSAAPAIIKAAFPLLSDVTILGMLPKTTDPAAAPALHAAPSDRAAPVPADPAPAYRALAADLAAWRGRVEGLLALPPEERPAAARALADEAAADPALAPALREALGEWIAGAYASAAADARQGAKTGGAR